MGCIGFMLQNGRATRNGPLKKTLPTLGSLEAKLHSETPSCWFRWNLPIGFDGIFGCKKLAWGIFVDPKLLGQIRSYQIFAKPMHAPLTFKCLGLFAGERSCFCRVFGKENGKNQPSKMESWGDLASASIFRAKIFGSKANLAWSFVAPRISTFRRECKKFMCDT